VDGRELQGEEFEERFVSFSFSSLETEPFFSLDLSFFGRKNQAFKSHQSLSPFTSPGTCDLTANVDFIYLTSLLPPPPPPQPTSSSSGLIRTLGPITQAQFLHSMGLGPRINGLIDAETDEKVREELWRGAKRLVDGGGMGEEYVVLGVESRCGNGKEEGEVGGEVYPFVKQQQ